MDRTLPGGSTLDIALHYRGLDEPGNLAAKVFSRVHDDIPAGARELSAQPLASRWDEVRVMERRVVLTSVPLIAFGVRATKDSDEPACALPQAIPPFFHTHRGVLLYPTERLRCRKGLRGGRSFWSAQ